MGRASRRLTRWRWEAVDVRVCPRAAQVAVLRDSLTAERDAAAATAAVVKSECEAKMAAELASASAAAVKQWQARLEEAAQRHATALQVGAGRYLLICGDPSRVRMLGVSIEVFQSLWLYVHAFGSAFAKACD